jgi:hypothetical protein
LLRSAFVLTIALLASPRVEAAAQRQAPTGSAEAGQPLTVSARVGGKTYEASGPGSCRHEPDASIYDVPAALWMVEYGNQAGDRIKQLNLTLWRPKDGSPDQVSLSLQTSASSHRISAGGKGEPVGSATVKLTPKGSGGRFDLKGKDADGDKVEVTISCPAFAAVEAEGG